MKKLIQIGPGMFTQSQAECADCHGNGNNLNEEDKCVSCKGEKIQREEKEFQIKIDCGAPNNKAYNLPGEGNDIVISISIILARSRCW